MQAEESLRDGDLQATLAQLQSQVQEDPANVKHRIFLFQLLSLLGQWERALTQLNVIGELDAGALPMVQMYREALHCEVLRTAIFNGDKQPLIFGAPEPWVAYLVEALQCYAQNRQAQAQALREQAFELAPATCGRLNADDFTWIADADMRLGPILEVIVNGEYYWVPFMRVRKILLEKPTDLRDLIWAPAHFEWANGGQAVGLIPARYSGSHQSDDNQLILSSKTTWLEIDKDVYQGLGQRVLTTDQGDYPLMEITTMHLNVTEAQESEGEDEEK